MKKFEITLFDCNGDFILSCTLRAEDEDSAWLAFQTPEHECFIEQAIDGEICIDEVHEHIVNATPHAVNLVNDDGDILRTFKPEVSVRVASTCKVVDEIAGIPIDCTTFGEVEGLPEYQSGVYYIVSRLVKQALPDREDLLCPGQQVRDFAGRVIGCKSLSR